MISAVPSSGNTASFGLRGVYMNIGENDDGNNFNFYGVQLNYTLDTSLGEGHYQGRLQLDQ